MRILIKFIFIISVFAIIGCDENPFSGFDKDDTPESLWFEVIQKINSKEYSEAILLLESIPDSIKLKRENLIRHSSAYAGFCGLDLISLVNDASGLSGRTPLMFFFDVFVDPTPEKLFACQTAISIIEDNVSDQADQRTADENIAMMAYQMISIGLSLKSKFDLDNDLSIDAGADSCNTVQISDTEIAKLGSQLVKMFSASIEINDIDLLVNIKDQVDQGCNGLVNASPSLDFCDQDDPSTYNPDQIRGVRSLIQEGEIFGIGSCSSAPNDISNCVCL